MDGHLSCTQVTIDMHMRLNYITQSKRDACLCHQAWMIKIGWCADIRWPKLKTQLSIATHKAYYLP